MKLTHTKKTNRVKGLCFHPKRPWLLVSFHDGNIELYEHTSGIRLCVFSGHFGPVRGIDFHDTQSIFASGGDDNTIKIWDFIEKSKKIELLGHSDYVRTVQFHSERPWLLSASDDQTVRVWNWQSRKCISVLTGHNHYVMCAQFHPTEDLMLSASLDETIRVWDISSLKSSTNSASNNSIFENSRNLFNTNGVFVKFVVEGHSRGVNWASFHPTESILVSSSDDREVKIWRYSDSRYWETDTIREHSHNVSCVIFDPISPNIILSNSEDRSIVVWDNSLSRVTDRYSLDEDRFWVLAAHPKNGLFAAGHDNGFVVFRTEPEFPSFSANQNECFYVKNGAIFKYNAEKEINEPAFSSIGHISVPEEILTSPKSHGDAITVVLKYSLLKSKNTNGPQTRYRILNENGDFYDSVCIDVSILGKNRIVVLGKETKNRQNKLFLFIKNGKNELKRKIELNFDKTERIFFADKKVLLNGEGKLILFDPFKKGVVADCAVDEKVTKVVWNINKKFFAAITKNKIYFIDENLKIIGKSVEDDNFVINNGIWDDALGTFLYTIKNILKYSLLNGENGRIHTFEQPQQLIKIIESGKNNTIQILTMDYSRNFYMFPLNRSEYEFKKAVELDNIEEVKKILDFSKFSGQKMVDFLLQKKYSKAALRFGRDENVQFGLALDCGDLDFAMKCAQKINDKSVWLKLGERAVELGFFDIAEKALILSENFFKLSFLYLVGDQKEKMEKLLQFAEKTENKALFLQISLFLNSENSLIKLLNNSGFSALAYAAIKAYNLNGEKFDIKIPAEVRNRIDRIRFGEGIKNCFSDKNGDLDKWPSKNKTVKNVNSEMEKILKSIETKTENLAKNEKMVENEFNDFQDWMAGLEKLEQAAEKVQRKEQSKLPAENQNSVNKNSQNLDKKLPKIGKKECLEFGQKWMENSPSAIDLISAQRFDLATERLYRKFGVVDPKPLQNLFLEIAQSTSMKMCLLPDFAPIRVGVSTRKKSFLKPLHGFNVEKVEREFDLALKKVTARKLEEAMADFKRILLILCVVEMSCDAEINKANEILNFCREYILALRCSKERADCKSQKRAFELSCYWTQLGLKPIHTFLGLLYAVNMGKALGFDKTTAVLCRRCLELGVDIELPQTTRKTLESVSQVLSEVQDSRKSAEKLKMDLRERLELDAKKLVPLESSEERRICGYCKSLYGVESGENNVCGVCQIGGVGNASFDGFSDE